MHEDVNDLLLFAEVARATSLAEVARRLHLPKSTVSRRLRKLEEDVGSRLLIRTTRKIVLTEVGAAYREYCDRVAEEVREARAFSEAVGVKPGGTLRITAIDELVSYYLGDLLTRFAERYPEISLDLDASLRRVDLVGERYDVAIRAGKLRSSSLVARKFLSIPFGLYASPRYLERGVPRQPEELAGHRFIMHSSSRTEVVLLRGNVSKAVPVTRPIVVNSLHVLRALILAGAGIAAMPVRMCEHDAAAKHLTRVLPEWSGTPVDVHYVVPGRQLLPAKTRLFVELLNETFGGPRQRPAVSDDAAADGKRVGA